MSKYIFSSKEYNMSNTKSGAIFGLLYAICFLAPIIFHLLLGVFAFGFDIMCVICIVMLCIAQSKQPALNNSYINIYDDHIEGVSVPNPLTISNANSGKRVNFNYDEIERIEAQATNHGVTIYTKYEKYDFQTPKCADMVIRVIKRQMDNDQSNN